MKQLLFIFLFIFAINATAQTSERYILTLEVRQSHFSLNIMMHINDAANVTTFQIPVDKQFFDSVQEGTVLNNDFRTGSLLLKGSIGSWKIKVKNKQIIQGQ